jgi:hypothetical protein
MEVLGRANAEEMLSLLHIGFPARQPSYYPDNLIPQNPFPNCLETGDPVDDDWRMWGASAAHNGLPD